MKIQCDVCTKDEASVFCSADEAALCDACDHRVHHANKLAGKHNRFSLLLPSPNNIPLCDICQEKRAFLFCKEDRAILCKECDVPIHKANEHTQKHNRFLLTPVKLSPTSSSSSPNSLMHVLPHHLIPSPKSINKPPPPPSLPPNNNPPNYSVAKIPTPSIVNASTSSISEYLIETLPGWHVEDFLDSSNSTPPPFFKTGESDLMSFWDADLESDLSSNFSSENMGILVPQAPTASLVQTSYSSSHQHFNMGIGWKIELKQRTTRYTNKVKSSSRNWRDNGGGCFNVPQITPPSTTTSKRSTTSWYN